MNTKITVVYSPVFQDSHGFLSTLNRCREAGSLVLYRGYGKPYKCADLEHCIQFRLDTAPWRNQLRASITKGDQSGANEAVNNLFYALNCHEYTPKDVAAFLYRFYQFIVVDQFIWIDPFKDQLCDIDNRLTGASTLEEYRLAFLQLTDFVCEKRLNLESSAFRSEISEIHKVISGQIQKKSPCLPLQDG